MLGSWDIAQNVLVSVAPRAGWAYERPIFINLESVALFLTRRSCLSPLCPPTNSLRPHKARIGTMFNRQKTLPTRHYCQNCFPSWRQGGPLCVSPHITALLGKLAQQPGSGICSPPQNDLALYGAVMCVCPTQINLHKWVQAAKT